MTAEVRLTDSDRLTLLAAAVADYLAETFSEGELDDDSNPPHTELANLADMAMNRKGSVSGYDNGADLDRELRLHAEHAESAFQHHWKEVLGDLGKP